MITLVDKLNELLADEWACVRVLRRAEALCSDPGLLEMIKRVRKDCSVNCVAISNVVRSLGGGPTDVPSARFSLKLKDESLSEVLDLAQSAQEHILDAVEPLLTEVDAKEERAGLVNVRDLHRENIRWLKSAVANLK